MTSYDPFLVCAPRDWLDYLSGLGPTVAASVAVALAGWQTWVAHTTLRRERQRTAPRVVVRKHFIHDANDDRLVIELHNAGETRALIDTLEVLVDGETRAYDPTQATPPQFWTGVLDALGLVGLRKIAGAVTPVPPFYLAAVETRGLLDVLIHGPNPDISAVIRDRLKCRGTYKSIWGERFSFPFPAEAATHVNSTR